MSTYSSVTLSAQTQGPTLIVGEGFAGPGVVGTITAITSESAGSARVTVQPESGEPVTIDVAGVAFAVVQEES